MQISVIILNWNAAQDTIDCIRFIENWQMVEPKIWIIDNASTGEDVVHIQHACPQVRVIANSQNLGFAGGTNVGLRAALVDDPTKKRPLLLLNNDVRLEELAIQQLVDTVATTPGAGMIGPLLYADAEQRKLIAAGSRNPVLHHHNLIAAPLAVTPYQVDYISGSVALLRAEMLQQVGLLDEDYFFSTEVADLCQRARRAGFATLVDPAVWALHDLDRSSPLRSTLYSYYIVRNRFLYIRKFYRWLRWPLLLFWALYGWLLMLQLRRKGETQRAAAIQLAVQDGWVGRFGGQNERVLAQ